MQCLLCHSDSEPFTKSQGRSFHLCQVCQLIFVAPDFLLPETEEKERYLEHENSLENHGYVKMFRDKIEVIQQHCTGIQSVLDYGCGYAPVLCALLEREGYSAQGYDCYFFPEWDDATGYDLIVSTEAFEHFRNPRKELERIETGINDAGYLAVMTKWYPLKDNQPDANAFQSWYYQRDPTHIVFYGPATFAWIADHWGMKLIHDNAFDFVIMRKTNASKIISK
jgi:SAM-dependent methyltransferase